MGSGAQSLGEDPSQGAKRGEAAPLTARTDLESCEARGRRYCTSAFLPPRERRRCGPFPSLPAGINRDDSDPAWGRIAAWDIEPLFGAAGDPRFGGGRYRPRLFFPFGTAAGI